MIPVDDLVPGLIVVHGNRAESLRELLLAWVRRHPPAPLETEVVLVQSNGIAQWLRLAFAEPAERGGLGIAAGLEFLLPSRFTWRLYRALLGAGAVPELSPFDKQRLIWRLLRWLPELAERAEFAPLARFLAEDGDGRKAFQLAGRLADLYDQYQVYRADWLAAWADGRAVRIDARGETSPLGEEQRWQARLWQQLQEEVGPGRGGRAAVHAAFMQRAAALADAPRPPGLPRRVLVFGLSAMPRQTLEALAALARWSQVLVCAHNPCRHYWADIISGRELLAARARRPGRPERLDEASLHLHAHPLLAAWGRQGRDTLAMLDEHDEAAARERHRRWLGEIGQRIDLFDAPAGSGLLAQLQEDILELRSLTEIVALERSIDPGRDASLRFHVAHGPQREVEILHDQLLAAFDADPGLKPRDIIVMVPDIDAYAPHIQAVFGLHPRGDPRFIPFSLADQSRRRFDPVARALERLLGLPGARMTADEVLDLVDVPALRRRFGFVVEDIPRLRRWAAAANIRWGLDGEHRAGLGLPAGEGRHTWRFGLDRLLLGYAAGAGVAWHGIESCAEIGGNEAARLAPLIALVERLHEHARQLREAAPVAEWCQRFRRLLADFFAAEEADEAYTLDRLEQALADWSEAAGEAGFDAPLPLAVAAEHWLSGLDAGGLSQRFFAGAVTFATLMPMRAIPFRRVCLLGMNDGDYPRRRPVPDFDLMAGDWRPGDRSRREDDRYLFLEALLSAREQLYISWVGRDIHDDRERPPSVLVGQLRDHIAAGWRLSGGDGRALLAALTLEHPLQPFSPVYFSGRDSSWFTYAREWRAEPVAPATAAPLPAIGTEEPLALADLAEFMRDPVRAFFSRRLGARLAEEDFTLATGEPFALDGLERWRLRDELVRGERLALETGMALAARDERLAAMHRRGDLPAGGFGARIEAELVEPLDAMLDQYRAALARWPHVEPGAREFRLDMSLDGVRIELADWLDGLRREAAGAGAGAVIVLESGNLVDDRDRYRAEKMIAHWLRHLAWQLVAGPVSHEVVSGKGRVRLEPLAADVARAHLLDLLAVWCEGMRWPLPVAAKTAFAWLAQRGNGESALRAACLAYEGDDWNRPGECSERPELARAYPDFAALHAGGFETWATRLYAPLLATLTAHSRLSGDA